MIPAFRRLGHPLILVATVIGGSLALLLAAMYFLLR